MFGLFFYHIVFYFFPFFLVLYSKTVNTRFIQRIIHSFKNEYINSDERLIANYLIIILLPITEFIAFFLKCGFILLGAICLGQEYRVVLSNLKDFTQLFIKSNNLIVLFSDLFRLLKNQLFIKIQYEQAHWNTSNNNFSPICRICSWLIYLYFVFSYILSFKNFALNLKKSFHFSP